jgi:hypothetical protein
MLHSGFYFTYCNASISKIEKDQDEEIRYVKKKTDNQI